MRKRNQKSMFYTLLLAAIIVAQIPYLGWPLHWMETYFHEISHALAAIATKGEVARCEIHWSGSGNCLVRGGWIPVIAFAGYLGAVFWGGLIFLIAGGLPSHYAKFIASFFMLFILSSMLVWVRDAVSLFICGAICGVFLLALLFSRHMSIRWFIQFIGLSVLLGAAKAPLIMFDGVEITDAVLLQQATFVPTFAWVFAWEFFAVMVLLYIWRAQTR